MPIYHLHLHNAHVDASDEDGHDLPDLASARRKAVAGIRDFLGHEAMDGRIDFRGHVDIADDTGEILTSVRFIEAFEVQGL